MRLYVPRVGTGLRLLSDWTFNVIKEGRNESLTKLLELPENWDNYGKKVGTLTIPAGTELFVDRVYIRRSNKAETENDYDSMTFRIKSGGLEGLGKGKRFFAKIADCNTMEVEPLSFDKIKKERTTLTGSQLRNRNNAMYGVWAYQPNVREIIFKHLGDQMTPIIDDAIDRHFRSTIVNEACTRARRMQDRLTRNITFESASAELTSEQLTARKEVIKSRWKELVNIVSTFKGKYLVVSKDVVYQTGKIEVSPCHTYGITTAPKIQLDCQLSFMSPNSKNPGHPVELVIFDRSGPSVIEVCKLKFPPDKGPVTVC